jgi:hypothetical protein
MRILFQLASPAYVRIYGSTIRELGGRGHDVLVSFDDPGKQAGGGATFDASGVAGTVPPLPPAARPYESVVERLRASADYLNYLDPRFAESPYLRRRLERSLDGTLRGLTRLPYGSRAGRAALAGTLALERIVPADDRVTRALAELRPDVTVVSPLIGRSARNRRQTDTVKSARRLGVPTVFGVGSWDHLTTKGVVKARPDRTLVWNDFQRRDAAGLHSLASGSVIVTGAQLFDPWFDRRPSTTVGEFASGLGLPSERFVVYVGSSPNIAPPEREIPFVRRWLEALRAAEGDLGVLIRPHPYNVRSWADEDLASLGAVVAPRVPPSVPMSGEDDALYFDSIHHAAAVVGINTSAMVEAFIQRKPVLTIADPAFAETQAGTPHFKELRAAAGPALATAGSVDEHLGQLRTALDDPAGAAAGAEAFLLAFVRPCGLERPATPIVADAIEGVAP